MSIFQIGNPIQKLEKAYTDFQKQYNELLTKPRVETTAKEFEKLYYSIDSYLSKSFSRNIKESDIYKKAESLRYKSIETYYSILDEVQKNQEELSR